jgi:nitrogen fixation/metabolism regulation signal transduction histidine kinase
VTVRKLSQPVLNPLLPIFLQEPLGEQLEEERAARARLEKENEAVIKQIEEIKTQSEDVIDQWKGTLVPSY